jgi:phosphate transport system protein
VTFGPGRRSITGRTIAVIVSAGRKVRTMIRLLKRPRPSPRPAPPAVEHRTKFHDDLDALEEEMRRMATQAATSLERSVGALLSADVALCERVIADDDRIDAAYQRIERHAVDIIGRQQPVASDLRLVVGLMQVALHLERIGDMAVDVATASRSSMGLPGDGDILGGVQEMGEIAIAMTDQAVEAFIQRDQAWCEQLTRQDDRVDALNRGMVGHVLGLGGDSRRLEWALRMFQVARYLERAADHAVDIAEQAWFLTTGEIRELD